MADDVTNRMLLEHMQAMKNDLQQQIGGLGSRLTGLESRVGGLEQSVANLAAAVHDGFEEARLHRQALQEDLEATMRLQGRHAVQLTGLAQKHP